MQLQPWQLRVASLMHPASPANHLLELGGWFGQSWVERRALHPPTDLVTAVLGHLLHHRVGAATWDVVGAAADLATTVLGPYNVPGQTQ